MPAFAKAWQRRASACATNVLLWRRIQPAQGPTRRSASIKFFCFASLLVTAGWTAHAATEEENLSSSTFRFNPDEDAQRLADDANIAYASGDYVRAARLYTQLLGMKPADARVFFNRANSYSKLRDGDRALADYSTALQIDPSFVPALVNRGSLFLRRKQFAEALSDFEKAAILRPDDGLIAYHRGLALARSENNKEAAEVIDHAIALAPGFAPARAERGFLYLADDDTAAAAKQFEAALKLEPANARARTGLRAIAESSIDRSEDGDDPLNAAIADDFVENVHRTCFSNADDDAALATAIGKMRWATSSATSTNRTRTWSLSSPFGRGQLVHVMPPGSPRNAVCVVSVDGVTPRLSSEIQAAVERRYTSAPPTVRGDSGSEHSEFRVPHGDDCEVTVSLHSSADDGRFTVRMSHEQKRPLDM